VAGIRLHPVQPAAVNGDNCALDIDQIVLTQTFSLPFKHYRRAVKPRRQSI
jgi:hypothetical protein